MKKLALFIFAFMFLANTLVVSAWAKPCMMDSPTQMSQDMDRLCRVICRVMMKTPKAKARIVTVCAYAFMF
jgi:hypothetical protein